MGDNTLHFYSYGEIAEDIGEDAVMATIRPLEVLSSHTGLVSDVSEYTKSTQNINGEFNTSTAIRNELIVARWQNSPNRTTAPNLCKGEIVEVYRYANSDNFFWRQAQNDVSIRKHERAVWLFSNKPTVDDPSKINQVYTFIVDTFNKFLGFTTDAKDNEYTTYDFKVNTGGGQVYLEDGKGNKFELDSTEDAFNFKSNKKHYIETEFAHVVAKNVVVDADNITFNCKEYTVNSDMTHINP